MKRSLGLKAWKSDKAKQMSPEQINKQLEAAKKLEFQKGFEHGLNISLPPKDNLTLITAKYQDKFNKLYADKRTGQIYKFIGIVIADDDYYYGLMNMNDKTWVLSSCVGYLEESGYEEVVK